MREVKTVDSRSTWTSGKSPTNSRVFATNFPTDPIFQTKLFFGGPFTHPSPISYATAHVIYLTTRIQYIYNKRIYIHTCIHEYIIHYVCVC